MFAPDELIAALADAGVEYVLIGGLAVGAHGFPRATKDLDIVPSPDKPNLKRLATLLRQLDAQHHGLGDSDPSEVPYDPLDPSQLAEGGNFVLTTHLRTPRHHAVGPGDPRRTRLRPSRARHRVHHAQRSSPYACAQAPI